MGYPKVERCPGCGSKRVKFDSVELVAGLHNVVYICQDCGAFIMRNEYTEPRASYFAKVSDGRVVRFDGSRASNNQGCCTAAIVMILITLSLVTVLSAISI